MKTLKISLFLILAYLLITLTACAKKGDRGDDGNTGGRGMQGYSMGLNLVSLDPNSDLCPGTGGVEAFNFVDSNSNNQYDIGETVTGAFFVCNGAQGNTGAQGSPGVNATPVTVVNLCPGSTTYPGVFVEIAFCINNRLYAVYSNPVFLTLIPSGNYSSQGLGSACSLTVAANCVVTH